MDAKEKMKRLRWQCRRGMLENDVVVQRYLQQDYLDAPADEQQCFEQLLQENDQKLFEWFTGKAPADPQFSALVAKMRGV